MDKFFDFALTGELLGLPFVRNALIAAAVLGLVAGVLGPLIVTRNMAFSVHATSEVAFTGGAAALVLGGASATVIGYGALAGAVVFALVIGSLSQRSSERDSVIGAVLVFGLGLGVLLLWIYPGRSSNKFGLLVGQPVTVNSTSASLLVIAALAVLVVVAFIYRPLLFASVDPEVAAARGVPVRLLSPLFAVLVAVATALGVQTVGALLVSALMIIPGAAASRLTSSPLRVTVLSVVFAEAAALGGVLASLAPGAPVSAFVTSISFLIYLGSRLIARIRTTRASVTRPMPVPVAAEPVSDRV